MKNIIKQFLLSVAIIGVLTACEKEEDVSKPILGLGGDTWPKGPLDEWITSNFTIPYNIDVKYRWDGSEVAVDRTLVPIEESKVRPVMETVKDAWIDVYVAEAGENFIKKFAPKQYVLVGSPQYNTGGTITLGEAEGGRKVTLYRLNEFDKTNRPLVKSTLKTIHHEFAHILHQNIMFPPEYQLITPSGYTADWNNTTLASARAAGYISMYAQASPSEDFVEMVALMLTEGKDGFDVLINSISIPDPADATKTLPNTTAQNLLRKKEAIVVNYFKQVYNIDIYKLQARTNFKIAEMAPVKLFNLLGFGKQFTSITVDPSRHTALSPDFMAAYNTASTGLFNLSTANRYVLDGFTLMFNTNNTVVMRVFFRATAGTNNGTSFQAEITYSIATTNEVSRLTFVSQNANAGVIAPGIVALTNYLTQNNFRYTWHYQGFNEFGGWSKSTDANSFFYGNLGVVR